MWDVWTDYLRTEIHQTILRHILIFGSECWTLTKRLEQQITTAYMKVMRMIQGGTRWDRKRNGDLYRQSNMLSIVHVINKNKLRWFGHVIRREEDSTLRAVMKLKMKGKRLRGRPILRSSHLSLGLPLSLFPFIFNFITTLSVDS